MKFSQIIKPYVSDELNLASHHLKKGEPVIAFNHLERAHVLAQQSPSQHIRTHVHMLWWGIETHSLKEILGQVFRLFGATTQYVTGYYPPGNTGGTDISPFKEIPIPQDLSDIIDKARSQSIP